MINLDGDVTPLPLYRIMAACSKMLAFALQRELPIRGAITIGTGVELNEGEIYGPVLAEAHRLESHYAEYPHVLISETVCEFVQSTDGFSSISALNSSYAASNLRNAQFICTDKDGLSILDYLCPFMAETARLSGVGVHTTKAIKKLHEFVKSEKLGFEQQGSTKLAQRYARMLDYVESRIAHWGVSSMNGADRGE